MIILKYLFKKGNGWTWVISSVSDQGQVAGNCEHSNEICVRLHKLGVVS